MWLRLSEELYLPYGELVGFFSPDAVETSREGKTRSFILLRDGRAIASATGLKTMQKKFLLSFPAVKRKWQRKAETFK